MHYYYHVEKKLDLCVVVFLFIFVCSFYASLHCWETTTAAATTTATSDTDRRPRRCECLRVRIYECISQYHTPLTQIIFVYFSRVAVS